jgi:CheY-like chemotaxis protein
LVDDEPLVRGVLRRLLEREGHVVLEAGSAEQAREVLRSPESAVEVVILDQSMPRETGIQALPSLRALTRAPVVLFTGMAPEVSPEVDALLEKPARPEELERVLRAVLAKRR